MNSELKILFVEDVPGDAELVNYEIKKNKIQFNGKLVSSREDYLATLAEFKPDIIISDFTLPRFTGLEALELRNKLYPELPFILVTGTLNEEIAVECMKAGADDYILKNNLSRLGPAVFNAIKKIRLLEEKRIAENALEESNERYRRLVDQSPDAIAVHYEGRFIFVNPAAVRLFGAPDHEVLLNKPILEIVHPSSREKVIERIKSVSQGIDAPVFEEKFVKFDGTVIDVEVLGIPYPYHGKHASQVIVRDITERKKSEEALKNSELKYRTIFENVQDIYFEHTIDGIILEVSPSIEVVSKGLYKSADVIGKSIEELYYNPEDRSRIKKVLMENGFISDAEVTVRNRDGSKIHTSISSRIFFDVTGNPVKIIGSMRDITARKKAEEAIEHERLLLRTVIDNIPDTIYIKDNQARKLIANLSDTRYIGYESEDMIIGKTDIETIPGEVGKRGFEDDMKVINTGIGVIEKEEDFIDCNGEKKWLLTTKVPFFDKEGKVAGLVGIGHDITRRKKTEDELLKAMFKAEESDRLKTAFLHNISHEIRTPMNAIVGFSALLSEPDTDEESRNSFIETIVQSSNHLLAIISDIVDISNIEANLVKINKKETDIINVVNSVFNQFVPEAKSKSIKLSFENNLPPNLRSIVSDSTKIRQILTNLISNAVKFTDAGDIFLTLCAKDDLLLFCVSDSGIGIPREHHSRIFDRFYQVENPTSKLHQGTGLGLAISRSYVDMLGGEIWFTSAEGVGSTFYFTIPFEPTNEPVLRSDSKYDQLFFSEKKTILVAEDNESNYRLINYYLNEANATIIRASNGLEVLDYFNKGNKADLVLMDIKMPLMDGYTAARKLREMNPNVPIIAQTAYTDEQIDVAGSGFNGFISKPFNKSKFVQLLREVL